MGLVDRVSAELAEKITAWAAEQEHAAADYDDVCEAGEAYEISQAEEKGDTVKDDAVWLLSEVAALLGKART